MILVRRVFLLLACIILAGGGPRMAAAADDVVLGSSSSVSVRGQRTMWSTDRPATEMQVRLHQTTSLEIGEGFGLYSALQLESLSDLRPGENRAVWHEGLYAEELFAQWGREGVIVRAGKLIPAFARAWHQTPVRFNTTLVSEYEIVEQTGIELSYSLTADLGGRHTISLSDTMADRSFLSQSMFTNRGQVHLADGGPSNTRWPQSVSVTYDAALIPALGGLLGGQVGVASLGRGVHDTGQERLATAGVDLTLPVSLGNGGRMQLRPLLEAARRWDMDGHAGLNADYVTAALSLRQTDWAIGAAYTHRTLSPPAGRRQQDGTFEADFTRFLGQGFSATAGYVLDSLAGIQTHTVAVQLSYNFTHCDGCWLVRNRR